MCLCIFIVLYVCLYIHIKVHAQSFACWLLTVLLVFCYKEYLPSPKKVLQHIYFITFITTSLFWNVWTDIFVALLSLSLCNICQFQHPFASEKWARISLDQSESCTHSHFTSSMIPSSQAFTVNDIFEDPEKVKFWDRPGCRVDGKEQSIQVLLLLSVCSVFCNNSPCMLLQICESLNVQFRVIMAWPCGIVSCKITPSTSCPKVALTSPS